MVEEIAEPFKALSLAIGGNFNTVDIQFHPRLKVLTGTNGAGKSTLLNIVNPKGEPIRVRQETTH